ncbi:hypothetical protein C1H46_012750 [Malus baccata]|uniref:Uncharacterized protein n=1 Tax=Malus baccata TaxID=106549 RepID=A0A540MSB2_MALBA|nr:hypothetical protein C1H46_012750 [Malus baccata]
MDGLAGEQRCWGSRGRRRRHGWSRGRRKKKKGLAAVSLKKRGAAVGGGLTGEVRD